MKKERHSIFQRKGLWLGAALAACSAGYLLQKRTRAIRAEAWSRRMNGVEKRTALVTGASSGIGAAYARKLAELGYGLVLVARREARLKELAAELESRCGIRAEVLLADLSTEAGIARVEERIASGGSGAISPVDFLVNNAGYDVFGLFTEIPIEKTLGLVNCLALASVRFSRAALPGMLARRRGAIVNVSSIGAFVAKPKDSTYVASKAFLNLFTESLSTELAGSGVRVQALCPGFTLTEFHDAPEYAQYRIKARIPRWLWMTPDQVVASSLRALAEDRVLCIPGIKNQIISAAGRSGLSAFLIGVLRRFLRPESQGNSAGSSLLPTRADLLELIACPRCLSRLDLQGTLQEGRLNCRSCGEEYPIAGGIPRFADYSELNPTDRGFARLYDWFSYVYLPFSKVASAFLGGERKVRKELLDRLEPHRGRVLEVSIGPGVNLPYLLENPEAGEIHGLDLSTGQLRRCQGFARRHGYPVQLYQGNAEALPFQDESFESVFHIGGINFFTNKKKAITEMIRVAKPGARILIADETERGAHGYELVLPGFRKLLGKKREPVRPPVDLVPPEMLDLRLDETAWRGWFYCLEFRKPPLSSEPSQGYEEEKRETEEDVVIPAA